MQHGAHQHVIGVLPVLDLVFKNRLGSQLHFFCQHRGAKHLDHLQSAAHKAQSLYAVLHQGFVVVFNILRQRGLGVIDDGIKLLLDPAQGIILNCTIWLHLQPHAYYTWYCHATSLRLAVQHNRLRPALLLRRKLEAGHRTLEFICQLVQRVQ